MNLSFKTKLHNIVKACNYKDHDEITQFKFYEPKPDIKHVNNIDAQVLPVPLSV